MDLTVTEEEAVEGSVGVKPTREVESGFDEEEFAVGVPERNGKGREVEGDVEEEEDGEPFVVEIVAVAEMAVEVREVGGGRAGTGRVRGNGDGEREGLVLPNVVGGEGGYGLEDLEVEGLEGGGGGGCGGRIGVYCVENGVV